MKRFGFSAAVAAVLFAAAPPVAAPATADLSPASLAAASGLSPDELRARLHAAGQSDTDIERYLEQANLGADGAARTAAAAPGRTLPAPEPPIAPVDSVRLGPPSARAAAPDPDEPFGLDIFRWAPSTFEPLTYGPVDAAYPLGPGDELVLTLWGDDQVSLSATVNREGVVTLPDVGQVAVSGLTLDEARARVRAALARVYSGLKPEGRRSTTFLSLSLGRLRTIQVFLLGHVQRPGGYTISSVSRVLNALYAAGGPTRDGSLREVRVLRGAQVAATVDLYDVVLGGTATTLERLQNGDVVFVPPAAKTVRIAGPVRRPGRYELTGAEGVRALLRLAGGPEPTADLARAQVRRIVPPALRDSLPGVGRYALDVPLGSVLDDSSHDVALLDDDDVRLFAVPERSGGVVSVTGRGVAKPGTYQFRPGMRVADLIADAGGLTPDAYGEHALVTRTNADSSRVALRFAPRGAVAGQASDNVALQALDHVTIRSEWDLKERQPVTVLGHVRAPGTYELLDGLTLGDLLVRAGGLTDDAYAARAEVARLTTDGRVADTIEVRLSRDLAHCAEAQAFVLEPHDAVFVRRDPDFAEQLYVTVDGEVRFPGTYALLRRDERVSDLVRRAGGLTDLAYARGATFRRNGGGRLAIDLPEALRNPRRSDNLVLVPGDTLRVPRFNPTVQVEGAVLNPVTALWQQGAGVGFYVTQASGFRQDADRRSVVVISPAGRVRKGGAPEPGSRVIVPAKVEAEPKDHLKDFATLMSILASAATTYFLVQQGTK